jgi:hypothetical protein
VTEVGDPPERFGCQKKNKNKAMTGKKNKFKGWYYYLFFCGYRVDRIHTLTKSSVHSVVVVVADYDDSVAVVAAPVA